MKRFLVFLSLLGLMMILVSCEDNNTVAGTRPPSGFSLEISLVDASHNPLEGYSAVVYPETDVESKLGRVDAVLSFTVPKQGDAEIIITDYFETSVDTLIAQQLSAGNRVAVYQPEDKPDGIYKASYSLTTHDSFYTTETILYQFANNNINHPNYTTDEFGVFIETSILPFPALYYDEPFMQTDEYNSNLGNFSFSDTVVVEIADNQGVVKKATCRVERGNNNLELVWDNMQVYDEKDKSMIDNTRDNDTDDEGPELEFGLYCYPNPFN